VSSRRIGPSVVLVALIKLTLAAGLLSISDMDRARAFTADPASAAAGERAGVLEGEIHYVEDIA